MKASDLSPQAQNGPGGLVGRGARDELPRHHPGRGPRRPGQQRLAIRAGGRQLRPPGSATRARASPASARYSARWRRTESADPQGRQGVDEPEELDPDLGVAQGPVHHPVVPPGALPGRRPAADPLEQLAADLPRPAIKGQDFEACRQRTGARTWCSRARRGRHGHTNSPPRRHDRVDDHFTARSFYARRCIDNTRSLRKSRWSDPRDAIRRA